MIAIKMRSARTGISEKMHRPQRHVHALSTDVADSGSGSESQLEHTCAGENGPCWRPLPAATVAWSTAVATSSRVGGQRCVDAIAMATHLSGQMTQRSVNSQAELRAIVPCAPAATETSVQVNLEGGRGE